THRQTSLLCPGKSCGTWNSNPRGVTEVRQIRRRRESGGASIQISVGSKTYSSVADAGGLLLLDRDRFVAQFVRLLDELLLLLGILFKIRREPQQQILVHERVGVVRLDLERAIRGRDPFLHELLLLRLLQTRVPVRLIPVVGGDFVEAFRIRWVF